MTLTPISCLNTLSEGTNAEWTALTVPIPDGALVYATDIRIFKKGDGSTLYSALPIFFDMKISEVTVGSIILIPEDISSVINVSALYCDGSSININTYADLFAVLGYTYGGSGNNFRIPEIHNANMRDLLHFIKY